MMGDRNRWLSPCWDRLSGVSQLVTPRFAETKLDLTFATIAAVVGAIAYPMRAAPCLVG